MKIRKASRNDYEKLKELKLLAKREESRHSEALRSLPEAQRYYFKYLEADLTKRNRRVFIALEDDEIAGVIVVKILKALPISKHDRKGYISNLYVREPFRNKGLGKKLAKSAMAWLESEDISCVSLEMHAKNLPAQNLYRGLGFKNYTLEMTKNL